MEQKSQGVGSIWNNNNWFYEEKNYTKFAKEYLTEALCKIEFKKNDVCVSYYEIKELKGEASITIRKQKQIFLFDFEAEIYFEAYKISDPNVKCKGKVKTNEINQDDDEINLEVTQEKPGDFVDSVKKCIRNDMQDVTLNAILSLSKAMRERDSDENKVKIDAAKREEAKKKVEEAKTQTGEEKQRIFDEAKKKEAEMKQAEAAKAATNQIPVKAVQNKVEGSGSVWNNNSYHWEQKSVDKWSEETLKKILSLFYYKQDRATYKIKEVKDFKGESSVSIRKGKKIVTYEYAVKLVWTCDLADEQKTKTIGSIEGEITFPEISNDEDDWDYDVSILKGDETLRQNFYQIVKKVAPEELKKQLKAQYVDELMKK